jgi:transposase
MPAGYSQADVAAVEGETSRRAAADRFAVSESTAIRLVQQWEQTGSLEPGRIVVIGRSLWRPMRSWCAS